MKIDSRPHTVEGIIKVLEILHFCAGDGWIVNKLFDHTVRLKLLPSKAPNVAILYGEVPSVTLSAVQRIEKH